MAPPTFTALGTGPRATPMRVIVCGVHRTGTVSMRAALRQLGFNDCYHMHNLLEKPYADPPKWIRAMEWKYEGKGDFTKADWDDLLGNSQSLADVPGALFGAELAELYPEAKVIILNRDPESWYVSVLESTYKSMRPPKGFLPRLFGLYIYTFDEATRNFINFGRTMARLAFGYDHGTEKDKALAWYENQYREFRTRIPEERRMEYHIKDGWEPLCAYLGVPVPTVRNELTGEREAAPFPRLNDRATFNKRVGGYGSLVWARANERFFSVFGRVAAAGLAGYLGYVVFGALALRRIKKML